jgi:hypothetical protein
MNRLYNWIIQEIYIIVNNSYSALEFDVNVAIFDGYRERGKAVVRVTNVVARCEVIGISVPRTGHTWVAREFLGNGLARGRVLSDQPRSDLTFGNRTTLMEADVREGVVFAIELDDPDFTIINLDDFAAGIVEFCFGFDMDAISQSRTPPSRCRLRYAAYLPRPRMTNL